jgi:predicted YcjX-like family ATPase
VLRVSVAPAGASDLPRFDVATHLAALIADPPHWPARTTSVSLLALDLELARDGLLAALGPRLWRLEFLDYPGEWLLDLPLLDADFADWSATVLRRLEAPETASIAREFLGFARGLPAGAGADEPLASSGHRLYAATLRRLRDEAGLAFLQPGRFLMPAPGAAPPWMQFFPLPGHSPLAALLGARFNAYVAAVRRDMVSPLFGSLDRLVVVASVRCTEDAVETLAGRPVSAVRGRIIGEPRPARSYPGEVPDAPPEDAFWQHRFLALPDFEPLRPPEDGRGGVAQLGLDTLLAFLLADIL